MSTLANILLVFGLIFPALSLLTGIGSLVHQWRHKEYSSPIFIPFIGPILLTCSILLTYRPLWLIPIAWILDIGTLAFFAVTPRLLRDSWRVSWFTRILKLHGTHDIQSAILTLHKTGHYLLKKSWNRPPNELGVVGLGEPGVFTKTADGYRMRSDHGLCRTLRRTTDGGYTVDEDAFQDEALEKYSLDGWVMEA